MNNYRKTYRAISIEGPTVVYNLSDDRTDIQNFIAKVADNFEKELQNDGVTVIGKVRAFANVSKLIDSPDAASVTLYATTFGDTND